MKKNGKQILALALALLLLTLTACAKAPSSAPAATAAPAPTEAPTPTPAPTPEPTPEPTPAPPTEAVYESMGMKLYVPLAFDPLIEVETGEDTLFSATEIASKEAGKILYPDNADGAGWLFSISRVTEEKLHDMLCYYMFGQEVFARDDEGFYYLLNTPTDVRLMREGEITKEDSDQWSAFYSWINGSVCDRFIEENGLTLCQISNTDVDVVLARIAWMGEKNYTVTGLADGTHIPEDGDFAVYAERILSSAYFEYTEEECPDGEYLVLELPESHARMDFFYVPDGRYVRMTQFGYELLFRCRTDVNVTQLVEQWYDALA